MSGTSKRQEKTQSPYIEQNKKNRRKILIFSFLVVCATIVTLALVMRHRGTLLADQLRDTAVDNIKTALIDSTQEKIETIALNAAAEIAEFLHQRDQDIMLLAELMPSDESYRVFSESRNSNMIPLYDEVTFVDLYGQELFKYVSPDSPKGVFPMNLEKVDITLQINTFAGMENYWEALRNLQPGEIFVSEVVGMPVGEGQRFEGIVRWATPVMDFDDEIAGFVTMALNHDHIINIMESTVVFPRQGAAQHDTALSNYMYIMNNFRTIIAHPRHNYILSDVAIEVSDGLYAFEAISFFTGQYSPDAQLNDNGFGFVAVIANADDFITPAVVMENHLNNIIDTVFNDSMIMFIGAGVCLLVLTMIVGGLLAKSVAVKNLKPQPTTATNASAKKQGNAPPVVPSNFPQVERVNISRTTTPESIPAAPPNISPAATPNIPHAAHPPIKYKNSDEIMQEQNIISAKKKAVDTNDDKSSQINHDVFDVDSIINDYIKSNND